MKNGIALLIALIAVAAGATVFASADGPCPPPAPPNRASLAARLSPEVYEQQQHQRAARATYDALLAAGAAETLACAAALNPDVLRSVAPIYFGRKAQ